MATLEEALKDIGRGEIDGNNLGPYVWSLTGRKSSGPWCAAATYAWLLRACDRLGYKPPFSRTHSARTFGERASRVGLWLPASTSPLPGDFAIWKRGVGRQGHIGIVHYVHDRGANHRCFITVEGNVGKYPAVVDFFAHRTNERKLLGFARLW